MADHNAPPWVLIVVAVIGATGIVLAAVLARPQRDTPTPMANAITIAAPLTATSMPLQACVVPQVERLEQRAAENAIIQLGLQIVKSTQYNAEIASGLVLSQDPPAGKKLNPCSGDVVIVVSLGPTPTPVPPTETSVQPTPIPLTPTPRPTATYTPRPTANATSTPQPIEAKSASSFSLWRYFPFNVGSYWVYEVESNSGNTGKAKETVIKTDKRADGVVQIELQVEPLLKSFTYGDTLIEIYECTVDSVLLRSIRLEGGYWGSFVGITYLDSQLIAQEPMRLDQTWFWNGKVQVYNPAQGDRTEDSKLSAIVLGLEDVTVRTQTFKKALHVQIIRTVHHLEPQANIRTIRVDRWLADGVGIVKSIVSDTSDDSWLETYELVEFQITQ